MIATRGTRLTVVSDRIPAREIEFHPHSFADPGGRLFRWRGEMYRAISRSQAPFVNRLLREGVVERLVQRGLLVETEPTHYRLEGYEMVLRHRSIPYPAYPNEWCAAMLKDAARCIIDLVLELAQHGLTLKDAHPWNVLFDVERDLRPLWIDFNSLAPFAEEGWPAQEEFRRFCFNPLALMSRGDDRLARLLMFEGEGVSDSLVARLAGRAFPFSSIAARARRQAVSHLRSLTDFLKGAGQRKSHRRQTQQWSIPQLRIQLEELSFPPAGGSPGADSQATLPRNGVLTRLIAQLLVKLRPASVLITSGNDRLVQTAAELNSRVVVFDTDAAFITRLYQRAQRDGWPVLPLLMDFTKPTPARGLCDHWAVAASERLRCDLLLASQAAIESAALRRHLNFEQIVEGLAAFSNTWVIAEFDQLAGGRSATPPGYTLDEFVKALETRFETVSILPSDSPQCVLLFGTK